jgi:hypothetical protein
MISQITAVGCLPKGESRQFHFPASAGSRL